MGKLTKKALKKSKVLIEFKPIQKEIFYELCKKATLRFVGKTFEIEGELYTLLIIRHSRYFNQKGVSFYFKNKKSIIRISDHWTGSNFKNSRKLNCSDISGQYWYCFSKFSEKKIVGGGYPVVLIGGKASLKKLNKVCNHFKYESKPCDCLGGFCICNQNF